MRWESDVEEQFKKTKYRELPKVDASYYDQSSLGFEVRSAQLEIAEGGAGAAVSPHRLAVATGLAALEAPQ